MHICYIDEAGCTGALPDVASSIQPVFVLAGVMLPHNCVKQLTIEWINLKQKHFAGRLTKPHPRFHDWMAVEVKGSELRKLAKAPSRNQRRFSTNFITEVIDLLERHHAKLAGRVFIKQIGGAFTGVAVYASTAQSICATFQSYLQQNQSNGFVIADSRNKAANASLSHSIFTQRHRAAGDPYPRIVEAPTFGHSDNHAGLQLADIVCSGLLFPIAAEVCSAAHLQNQMHCSPRYLDLRARFGARLRAMQWTYLSASNNQVTGGVSLKDVLNNHRASVLFTPPAAIPVQPSAIANAMAAVITGTS